MVDRIRPKPTLPDLGGRPSQYDAKIFPRTWSLVLRDSSLVLHRNINFIPKKGVVQRIDFQHYCGREHIVHHPASLPMRLATVTGVPVGSRLRARILSRFAAVFGLIGGM